MTRFSIVVDIVNLRGVMVHLTEELYLERSSTQLIVDRGFDLAQDETNIEARIRVIGPDGWACSYPQLAVADRPRAANASLTAASPG